MSIRLFLYCILLVFSVSLYSTHIVGGELTFKYKGSNYYSISLKLYRDCYNGLAGFDDPAYIFLFESATGNLLQTLEMYNPVITTVPLTSNDPCIILPSNVCVEEGAYMMDVLIASIPTGGIDVVYQRCCRNNTIINLSNPGLTGSTYTAHISDKSASSMANSSPVFNEFPPLFLCAFSDINFDHSATDPDGDSLVYGLCAPFSGADSTCPKPNPYAYSPCATSPPPPPYNDVIYSSSYNGTYPLSANPALSIDPVTGMLKGTPMLSGQFVVGICVSEYRNGILLSTNKRDFQFNILDCNNNFINIPVQQELCSGFSYSFTNSNFLAASYFWDFGVSGINSDTSILKSPTYTYADTGIYTVMHIAHDVKGCSDTDFVDIYIYPNLLPEFAPPDPQCIKGNSFDFEAGGLFQPYAIFEWNFGNAVPAASFTQNPIGIGFIGSGTLPVTLTVRENGCEEKYVDSVIVYPIPEAYYSMDTLSGCAPFTASFEDNSLYGTLPEFYWDFGDGYYSDVHNPKHTFLNSGNYDVTLTLITKDGCIDTSVFQLEDIVRVLVTPNANILSVSYSESEFEPVFSFLDYSENSLFCLTDYGDGTIDSICGDLQHEYADTGTYEVMQIVTNNIGCSDTAYTYVRVNPEYRFFIPNSFTPDYDNLNDIFMPKVIGVEEYEFYIFNRWGRKIFFTSDKDLGWDGNDMESNKPMPSDSYNYRIKYKSVFGKEFSHIGKVILIR